MAFSLYSFSLVMGLALCQRAGLDRSKNRTNPLKCSKRATASTSSGTQDKKKAAEREPSGLLPISQAVEPRRYGHQSIAKPLVANGLRNLKTAHRSR
jgi:hypothetical protein